MVKNPFELGDGPIESRYENQMKAIAQTLDEFLNPGQKAPNKKIGFVVLLFEYGEQEGRCNYISNGANREDIVVLLEEQAKRFREDMNRGKRGKY